jgi:hypothetical protein
VVAADFLRSTLNAATIPAVEQLLGQLPIADVNAYNYDDENPAKGWAAGKFHWVPVGLDRGNAGRIRLAGKPIYPLAERLVNGMEALIELKRLRELRHNPTASMPNSPREAVARYYGLPPLDQIPKSNSRVDGKPIRNYAWDLSRLLLLKLDFDKKRREFAVSVRDQGMGQIRLTPGGSAAVRAVAEPRADWAAVQDFTSRLDPEVPGLAVAVERGVDGAQLTLTFTEPEDMDEDEYPLSTTLSVFAKFDGHDAPRMLQLPVVVVRRKKKGPKKKRLTVTDGDKTWRASGVCVYYDADSNLSIILTAGHVVQDARQMQFEVFSADSYPDPARVYKNVQWKSWRSRTDDIGVVIARIWVPVSAKVSDDDPHLDQGEHLLSIGCGIGAPPVCQIGRYVGRHESGDYATDMGSIGGRSGGPLFSQTGKVIGILSRGRNDETIFVSQDKILRFVKQVNDHMVGE